MHPVTFNQANGSLTGGPAAEWGTHEDVGDLPVYRDANEIISCWRPSFGERLVLLFRPRLWLRVLGGSHPPVSIEVNVFE